MPAARQAHQAAAAAATAAAAAAFCGRLTVASMGIYLFK